MDDTLAFAEDAITDQDAWEASGRFLATRTPQGFAFRLAGEHEVHPELLCRAQVLDLVGEMLEVGARVSATTPTA